MCLLALPAFIGLWMGQKAIKIWKYSTILSNRNWMFRWDWCSSIFVYTRWKFRRNGWSIYYKLCIYYTADIYTYIFFFYARRTMTLSVLEQLLAACCIRNEEHIPIHMPHIYMRMCVGIFKWVNNKRTRYIWHTKYICIYCIEIDGSLVCHSFISLFLSCWGSYVVRYSTRE